MDPLHKIVGGRRPSYGHIRRPYRQDQQPRNGVTLMRVAPRLATGPFPSVTRQGYQSPSSADDVIEITDMSTDDDTPPHSPMSEELPDLSSAPSSPQSRRFEPISPPTSPARPNRPITPHPQIASLAMSTPNPPLPSGPPPPLPPLPQGRPPISWPPSSTTQGSHLPPTTSGGPSHLLTTSRGRLQSATPRGPNRPSNFEPPPPYTAVMTQTQQTSSRPTLSPSDPPPPYSTADPQSTTTPSSPRPSTSSGPQPSMSCDPQPSMSCDPQPSTSYDPQPSTSYAPQRPSANNPSSVITGNEMERSNDQAPSSRSQLESTTNVPAGNDLRVHMTDDGVDVIFPGRIEQTDSSVSIDLAFLDSLPRFRLLHLLRFLHRPPINITSSTLSKSVHIYPSKLRLESNDPAILQERLQTYLLYMRHVS